MVETGCCFFYRGRAFLKSGKMNKRHYATDMDSGRMYMFPPTAQVKSIERPTNIYGNLHTSLATEVTPGQEFIHRNRKFSLDARVRSRLTCTDLETGQKVVLHNLMHVGVRRQQALAQ